MARGRQGLCDAQADAARPAGDDGHASGAAGSESREQKSEDTHLSVRGLDCCRFPGFVGTVGGRGEGGAHRVSRWEMTAWTHRVC